MAQLLGRGFLVRQQLGRIIVGSSSSCGISWEFSRLENSDMKVLDFSLDGLIFFRDSSPQKFLSSEGRGL